MPTRTVDGKIGLALSGGGFRAAFFHVGVLARLAELRILPKLHVISTVSGGSIIGAAYYLVLKNRLEDPDKGPIADREYEDLVREVETKLLAAVRKNLRGRVFANPLKTIWMAWPSYSRSDRIGDLYDRHLYKQIWQEGPNGRRPRNWKRLGRQTQIAMHELNIEPRVEGEEPPKFWINATTLNTGHDWRFGTLQMGETLPKNRRKAEVVEEVDKNVLLERSTYERTDGMPWVGEKQERFPLALAVAASASVPILFHPLSISRVYDGYRVELVDGGVQDNQGIQGLLDEKCRYLIVSDASGQMDDLPKPATLVPSVAGRTMSIYGDRIRDEQLTNAPVGGKKMALLHLRKGLTAQVVPTTASPEPHSEKPEEESNATEFGVHKKVQAALSRIRTDLDYFGDCEAFSLMLDGYLMSDREFNRPDLEELRDPDATEMTLKRWQFGGKHLSKLMANDPSGAYARQLNAGRRRFMRTIALLRPWLAWTFVALALVALVGVAAAVWRGAIGDALDDVWHDQWSAQAVLGAVAGVLLVLGAYLATAFQQPVIRYPVAVIWIALLILPALILSVFRWLTLPVRLLAVRLGRVPPTR